MGCRLAHGQPPQDVALAGATTQEARLRPYVCWERRRVRALCSPPKQQTGRLAPRNALQYTRHVREIHWTDKAEDHIWSRHQVTPDEVEQVVYTRPRWVTNGRDDTTYVLGQTNEGRYLLVVLSPLSYPLVGYSPLSYPLIMMLTLFSQTISLFSQMMPI